MIIGDVAGSAAMAVLVLADHNRDGGDENMGSTLMLRPCSFLAVSGVGIYHLPWKGLWCGPVVVLPSQPYFCISQIYVAGCRRLGFEPDNFVLHQLSSTRGCYDLAILDLMCRGLETADHLLDVISMNLQVCMFIVGCMAAWWGGGGGRGHGVGLFAFGGAYWPLATAHPDPLWVRTCSGCVNGAPG